MLIRKLRLAVAAIAACVGVVLAGGLVLRAQPGGPLPPVPNAVAAGSPSGPEEPPANRAVADGPRAEGKDPEGQIDETARKEIEALRKRVEALEKMQKRMPKPPAPVPQKIVVTTPRAQDVVITHPYVGKVHARRHINVRALTNGIVEAIPVKEGQAVKKGDVMFRILPVLYKARYEAERAEARLAQIELDHTKKLFEQKVVGPQEVALYQAKLARAEAKLKLAEAELNFTEVKAPFDGLVGRLQEQEGSAVKEGDVLTTLSDNAVMWVYFDISEARYLEYKEREGKSTNPSKLTLVNSRIELKLANGSKFKYSPGDTVTVEGNFNNQTGNISFRADFPNPDGLLRHGQTDTLLIHETLKNAIIIPQRATFEVLDKRYVWVVGQDSVVHRREIVIGQETDGIFVVKKGLGVNDRIVVDGVRQLRDGEKVEYEFRRPEEVIGKPNNQREE